MALPEFFPLAIFPEGGLAGSVITTVWVGMAVVVFFNLRFGWVLSGLVIPGYLVPLLLAKPAAAFVVVAEGVATYGLVWLYSEYLSARLGWNNFFGRDRFFALVLCSILVRIVSDGFLLPALGEWLNHSFQWQLDYRNNLHSFGLIIVSLIANNFWKTGLRRGVIPLLVTVGLTLLIVRYLLMTLTNFNISSLSYAYEDLATSILASPKAYIILVVTAFLASRMNLLYGWDFSGILVPSLLALQWYQPGKILATFAETGVILLLAHGVLQLPMFRGMTIEGGRKLLLFFNISYLYKFVLAYLMLWWWPEQKISDIYGFGYLLPTLLATKMYEKGIYARMTRATLQVSLVAALGATLLGFALTWLPDPWAANPANAQTPPAVAKITKLTLIEATRQESIAIRRSRLPAQVVNATGFQLDQWRAGLLELAQYRRERQPEHLVEASRLLDQVGLRVELIENRYLLLRENEPRRFWGFYALDLETENDLALEVPAPLDERGTLESGAWLMRVMGAQSLAIASAPRRINQEGSVDVLAAPQTPYQVFHQVFGNRQTLQVRGYTGQSARLASASRRGVAPPEAGPPASSLWVKRALPDGLDLSRLKDLIGDFEVRWGELPLQNLQRETTLSGFAELQLRSDAIRRLLGRALASEGTGAVNPGQAAIDGSLPDWLLADTTRIAPPGSNLYRKPAVEELLFFDDEVVTPLLRAVAAEHGDKGLSDAGKTELRIIEAAAASLGYQLLRFHHRSNGSDYLILAEAPSGGHPERLRYWGSYIFRLGVSQSVLVQVPRPVFEVNSLELALALFESMHARALLIGGASPEANQDHSADLLRFANKENVFNAVNQAILRESGSTPLLIVQSRSLGERRDLPMPGADIVLATTAGAQSPAQMSALGRRLIEALTRFGLRVAFSDGTPAMAGYEAGGLPQAFYLNATQNKEMVVFWASPLARAGFMQQTEATPQQAQADALGLRTLQLEIGVYLARHGNRLAPLPPTLRAALAPYFLSQDIVLLQAALRQQAGLRFERLVDINSRLGFLSILDDHGRLLGLANLSARDAGQITVFQPEHPTSSLTKFVETRSAWLLSGATP